MSMIESSIIDLRFRLQTKCYNNSCITLKKYWLYVCIVYYLYYENELNKEITHFSASSNRKPILHYWNLNKKIQISQVEESVI